MHATNLRKSDTWRKDSKNSSLNELMPFACFLLLFQEKARNACKSTLLGLGWNWSTQVYIQEPAQLLGKNVHF